MCPPIVAEGIAMASFFHSAVNFIASFELPASFWPFIFFSSSEDSLI